jgi:hypothetical protein
MGFPIIGNCIFSHLHLDGMVASWAWAFLYWLIFALGVALSLTTERDMK